MLGERAAVWLQGQATGVRRGEGGGGRGSRVEGEGGGMMKNGQRNLNISMS